jgi:uncharacterized protein (DUF342 family)
MRIADKIALVVKNETMNINVGKDKMDAFVSFVPPEGDGVPMTRDEILGALGSAGIVNVDEIAIDKICTGRRDYREEYLVAVGTPATPGEDGWLENHYEQILTQTQPKIMDDGSVNYKELNLIRITNRGDILVTAHPAKDGVDGVNVYGNPIPFPKVKPAPPLPIGKNTVISPDGLHLITDISGMIVPGDRKLNIAPNYEVKENVDNSTGNITFNGAVTVRGNVLTGFSIKAAGDIDIYGVCEGATLISDANIMLGNGVQGMDKATIIAAGNVTAKFLDGCTVKTGGDVIADSIIKSQITCDGSVILTGKNGLLMGGHTIVGKKLRARTIGSNMGTITEIEVGTNPVDLINHKNMVAEYNRLKVEYEKVDQAVTSLKALHSKGQLNDDKKNLLLKMVNAKMSLQAKMKELQEKIEEQAGQARTNTGMVIALKTIKPGVRVIIGNAQLTIGDEISNCCLTNNGEKIVIGAVPASENKN